MISAFAFTGLGLVLLELPGGAEGEEGGALLAVVVLGVVPLVAVRIGGEPLVPLVLVPPLATAFLVPIHFRKLTAGRILLCPAPILESLEVVCTAMPPKRYRTG